MNNIFYGIQIQFDYIFAKNQKFIKNLLICMDFTYAVPV